MEKPGLEILSLPPKKKKKRLTFFIALYIWKICF